MHFTKNNGLLINAEAAKALGVSLRQFGCYVVEGSGAHDRREVRMSRIGTSVDGLNSERQNFFGQAYRVLAA